MSFFKKCPARNIYFLTSTDVTKRCNRMATIFNGIKVTSLHVLLQSMSTGGSVVLGKAMYSL